MQTFYTLTAFCRIIATCIKALLAIASSSFDASSAAWSLAPLLQSRWQQKTRMQERSGVQTRKAVLLTAVCPFAWIQVRCSNKTCSSKPLLLSPKTYDLCRPLVDLRKAVIWCLKLICKVSRIFTAHLRSNPPQTNPFMTDRTHWTTLGRSKLPRLLSVLTCLWQGC